MQQKSVVELVNLYKPILKEKGIEGDKNMIEKVVSLVKERAVFVADFWKLSNFFFEAPITFDEKAVAKNWKEDTSSIMKQLLNVIIKIDDFSSQNTEVIIKDWITKNEIGFGKVMQPLRLSLVGEMKGPHLFDIMEIIGKQETIQRIESAIKKF